MYRIFIIGVTSCRPINGQIFCAIAASQHDKADRQKRFLNRQPQASISVCLQDRTWREVAIAGCLVAGRRYPTYPT
jgi:hypothetical protein